MKKKFLKKKDKTSLPRNDQETESKQKSKKFAPQKNKYKHPSHWLQEDDYDPLDKDEEE